MSEELSGKERLIESLEIARDTAIEMGLEDLGDSIIMNLLEAKEV